MLAVISTVCFFFLKVTFPWTSLAPPPGRCPSPFENRWSGQRHITVLQFYGEIYKAAQAHSCWLQPVQLAQQWEHGSLYLGRHFQLSNKALWGTQQTGLAFPLYCTSCLTRYHAEQEGKERLHKDESLELHGCTHSSIQWISIQCLLKKHHYLKEK